LTEGGVCIKNTNFKKNDKEKDLSQKNSLSKLEVTVNRIAGKLVNNSDNKKRFFENSFFAFIKSFSSLWYNGSVKIEHHRKKSDIVKKYVNRCDSLVKKLMFVLSVLFAMIYAYIPNEKLKFREQLTGAMFSAIGWSVFSWCFSIYVSRMGAGIYGSLSVIILVMIWMYVCMYIVMIGAYLNHYFNRSK
jgi:YihY family inner membrane protein